MDVLGTVATCLELVQKCVEIISEIRAWPKELRRVLRRITMLEPILTDFVSRLEGQPRTGLVGIYPEQERHLKQVIQDTKEYCEQTHQILDECQSRRIGKTELEFRDSWLGELSRIVYQKYGPISANLQTLEENLESSCTVLNDYMRMLTTNNAFNYVIGQNAQLQGQNAWLARQYALFRTEFMTELRNISARSAATVVAPQGGQPNNGSLGPYQSVPATLRQSTPESRPARTDHKILFIDTWGNRSAVSQIITILLDAATRSQGRDLRLHAVTSMGFVIKDNCDCLSEMLALNFVPQMFNLVPPGRGHLLDATIWQSLYNAMKHYVHPSRVADVNNYATRFSGCGPRRDMFREYDFIIVFSRVAHNTLLSIRNALVTSSGPRVLARGKGRIVHLGQYLSSDGNTKDIAEPLRRADGTSVRENWDLKIPELKLAIKGFLAAELGWTPP